MNSIGDFIVAGNFILIIIALYFNFKVLRDRTKKDYILPWKFTFIALFFFLAFEIIGVLEGMGLFAYWRAYEFIGIFEAIARVGIVGAFLFGLILEDKHEIYEEKQIVKKMLKTKRERHEIGNTKKTTKPKKSNSSKKKTTKKKSKK